MGGGEYLLKPTHTKN